LISPILRTQDEQEISLHAHIGALYRQFQFLSKEWLMENLDLVVPSISIKPTLWRAFMDGFCYVTDYSPDMYIALRNKGHLLEYLRLDISSEDQNSRIDRLQSKVLELSAVAYVLGDEDFNTGIISSVLEKKDPEEWQQMIWSIQSILGDAPDPNHLLKAKCFISELIEIRELNASKTDFKEHFKGLGRFLELIDDPSDELVKNIVGIVSDGLASPWAFGDIIEYLHRFRDSHTKTVGSLFKQMLEVSKAAPAWPPEKVKDIFSCLRDKGEIETMIDICRIYSDRSPTCEPIREICNELK
jgi:hypothetical protein